MGGKPRKQQQWVARPSPLAKVHHTRPISQDPSMGLVRDPQFWKRFSLAVHMTEDPEKDPQTPVRSVDMKFDDDWLTQQRKEKRRCRILCVSITVGVAVLIAAAVVVILYFTRYRSAD